MSPNETIRSMLAGGDRRSIGRADEAATLVLKRPEKFAELIACLWADDPAISMRAADAAEKASRERPELLQPHTAELLGLLAETAQQELRWHLAAMVSRLRLTPAECQRTFESLMAYLDDRSSIVKASAMQGLFELAMQTPKLRRRVLEILRLHARTGTAAMRARGRKLIPQLEQRTPESQPAHFSR